MVDRTVPDPQPSSCARPPRRAGAPRARDRSSIHRTDVSAYVAVNVRSVGHARQPDRRRGPVCDGCYESAAVSFPDQLQAGQGQEVVHLVDLVAEGDDRGRVAARGDRGGLLAELLAQAAEDAVDLAGVAVDHSRLDRLLRTLADRVAGLLDVHPRQPRRPGGQGLQRDLDPRRDHAAQVLAGGWRRRRS